MYAIRRQRPICHADDDKANLDFLQYRGRNVASNDLQRFNSDQSIPVRRIVGKMRRENAAVDDLPRTRTIARCGSDAMWA